MKDSRRLARAAAVGAAAFTAGRLIALAAELSLASLQRENPSAAYPFQLIQAAYFLGGAVAFLIVAYGRLDPPGMVRGAVGFGLGFWMLFYGAIAFFYIIKESNTSPATAALGYAMVFTLCAGFAALFHDWRAAPLVAAAFALPAALAGVLLLNLPDEAPLVVSIPVHFIPYTIGGALFGLLFASRSRTD